MTDSTESMIEGKQPDGYDSSVVLGKLPSPIFRDMREIYHLGDLP